MYWLETITAWVISVTWFALGDGFEHVERHRGAAAEAAGADSPGGICVRPRYPLDVGCQRVNDPQGSGLFGGGR